MTGTLINVAAVLAGTALGTLVGARLPQGLQERVLFGLGLVLLVLGVDLALDWRNTEPLYVLGGVLVGGLVGEALDIEGRLRALGDRLQRWSSKDDEHSQLAEGFFTASLLFCVGPLAVIGAIQEGLTGEYDPLVTKALLDGFTSVALAASLGVGVALSGLSILVYQGGLTLFAGVFDQVLEEGSAELHALTSAGGVLIIGIALRMLDLKDVKVGNFLPALVLAPAIAALGEGL